MKKLFSMAAMLAVMTQAFAVDFTAGRQDAPAPMLANAAIAAQSQSSTRSTEDAFPSDMWGYSAGVAAWDFFGVEVTDFKAIAYFNPEITNILAGKKITRLGIVSPILTEQETMDLSLFISYDLSVDPEINVPFTSEGCRMDAAGVVHDIRYDVVELPEPVEIQAGVPFFVGVAADTLPATVYPMPDDRLPNPGALSLLYTCNGAAWTNFSHIGSLCVYLGLDEAPEDMVRIIGFDVPSQSVQGMTLDSELRVFNIGSNTVENVNINVQLGRENPVDFEASATNGNLFRYNVTDLEQGAIPPHTAGIARFSGFPFTTSGVQPLIMKIDKVNNQENLWKIPVASSIMLLPEGKGYSRNVVVEEATGTWCGWCVRGYVGMEHMAETYTDGSYIGIAAHYGDDMAANTYMPLLQSQLTSFPSAFVNRMEKIDPSTQTLEEMYKKYVDIPTYGKISLEINDVNSEVASVTSTSEFAFSGNYSVAYVVKENGVGPYRQTNNYAGGAAGEMGGFEDEDTYVDLMYSDVARNIFDVYGMPGSLPTDIEVDTPYEHTAEISLANVTDVENASIVAMIIDQTYGYIVNAVVKSLGNSSVSDIADTVSTDVIASRGMITLAGEENGVVYDMGGRRIAAIAGNGSVAVAPGFYIVTVAGRAHKVVVK